MTDQNAPGEPTILTQWICEPYGAPTPSSEVSRVVGFYSAVALTVFGAAGLRTVAEAVEKAA